MCGHNNSGSSNLPIRNCACTWDDLDDPDPGCRFTTSQEVEDAIGNKKQLGLMGKKNIKSCFDEIPLSDDTYGIMGITPPEMLHVAGTGIFKYMFSCIIVSQGFVEDRCDFHPTLDRIGQAANDTHARALSQSLLHCRCSD